MLIFQLTSSRRGWRNSATYPLKGTYFNSHPHEEDDVAAIKEIVTMMDISTHILTKRMTLWRHGITVLSIYFNSHPHEEDDCNVFVSVVTISRFQLTSSRRGWPIFLFVLSRSDNFNSHPHEEDDCDPVVQPYFGIISTHILTKRMTCLVVRQVYGTIFQLTSSRRGWRFVNTNRIDATTFQLTSSRRGWHMNAL